jgi:hypothetical protein
MNATHQVKLKKVLVNSLSFYSLLSSIVKTNKDHMGDYDIIYFAAESGVLYSPDGSIHTIGFEGNDFGKVPIRFGKVKRFCKILKRIQIQPITVFFEDGKIITTISI